MNIKDLALMKLKKQYIMQLFSQMTKDLSLKLLWSLSH